MENVYILSCLSLEQIKTQIINTGTCCLRLAYSKDDAVSKKRTMGMDCKLYRLIICEESDVS